MFRRMLAGVALGCLAAAGGCATQAVLPDQSPEQRLSALEQLQEFSFSGALGIWTDEKNNSARISWQQSDAALLVDLSGPLGIGNLRLEHDATGAVLSRSGRPIVQGESVDRVLQQGLGLEAPVPMQQLQQWVKGLPGEARSARLDDQGKLSSLAFVDESGTIWQAQFLRYSSLDGVAAVPALIVASGGPYSVRLVLKNWQARVPRVVPEETKSNTRLVIPSQ